MVYFNQLLYSLNHLIEGGKNKEKWSLSLLPS